MRGHKNLYPNMVSEVVHIFFEGTKTSDGIKLLGQIRNILSVATFVMIYVLLHSASTMHMPKNLDPNKLSAFMSPIY